MLEKTNLIFYCDMDDFISPDNDLLPPSFQKARSNEARSPTTVSEPLTNWISTTQLILLTETAHVCIYVRCLSHYKHLWKIQQGSKIGIVGTILLQFPIHGVSSTPPSNSLTPTGCPTFHLNTDNTHLVGDGLANLTLNKQVSDLIG